MPRVLPIIALSLACALVRAGDFFGALEFPATPNNITSAEVSALEGKPDAESLFRLGVCRYLGAGTRSDKPSAVVLFASSAALKSENGAYAYALALLEGDGVEKDAARAVKILAALDRRGYAPATRALGACYASGEGAPKSHSAARAMLEKAFIFGSSRAAVELAVFCAENGEKISSPRGLLDKLSEMSAAGNIEASYALSRLYQSGVAGKDDIFEANSLLSLCAARSHAPSQYRLGMNYIEGKGVVADAAKGAALLKLAAEGGSAQAMNNYGVCCQNGIGVEKDISAALDFYRKSAALGYAVAQNNLGVCYLKGFGGSAEEAAKLFLEAARAGDKDAVENIASCYLDGVGVAKNAAEAAYWLKIAAEFGSVEAKGILGRMYVDGVDVERNLKAGIELLLSAAAAGDAEAMLHLGACYYTGTGVAKDEEKALAYFRKSAELGNKKAKETLRKISQ